MTLYDDIFVASPHWKPCLYCDGVTTDAVDWQLTLTTHTHSLTAALVNLSVVFCTSSQYTDQHGADHPCSQDNK